MGRRRTRSREQLAQGEAEGSLEIPGSEWRCRAEAAHLPVPEERSASGWCWRRSGEACSSSPPSLSSSSVFQTRQGGTAPSAALLCRGPDAGQALDAQRWPSPGCLLPPRCVRGWGGTGLSWVCSAVSSSCGPAERAPRTGE